MIYFLIHRFNNSGTFLISSGMDKQVKLWDLQGNCLKTLFEHTRYVNCITINIDSSIIASGSNDRKILIWDLTGNLSLTSNISGMRSLLLSLASSQGDVPQDLICPITHEIMKNPVTLEDGFSYECQAITEWFAMGKQTSPMTNMTLLSVNMIENNVLKSKIDNYLKALDFDTFE